MNTSYLMLMAIENDRLRSARRYRRQPAAISARAPHVRRALRHHMERAFPLRMITRAVA